MYLEWHPPPNSPNPLKVIALDVLAFVIRAFFPAPHSWGKGEAMI
jgi:hypothetical protein